jgi:hypothetical protein
MAALRRRCRSSTRHESAYHARLRGAFGRSGPSRSPRGSRDGPVDPKERDALRSGTAERSGVAVRCLSGTSHAELAQNAGPERVRTPDRAAPWRSSAASESSSGGRPRSWRPALSRSSGRSSLTHTPTSLTTATSCVAPRSSPARSARSPTCRGSRSAARPTCAPTRRAGYWRTTCRPGGGRPEAPRGRPGCRSGSSRTARRRRCGSAPTCSSGNGPMPR